MRQPDIPRHLVATVLELGVIAGSIRMGLVVIPEGLSLVALQLGDAAQGPEGECALVGPGLPLPWPPGRHRSADPRVMQVAGEGQGDQG